MNNSKCNHDRPTRAVGSQVFFWLLLGMLALSGRAAFAEAMLEDVTFTALPGKSIEVQMRFDSAPENPSTYLIESPPRLVLDLWDASSSMSSKMLTVNSNSVDSLHFVEAQDRLRIVANLNNVVEYTYRIDGNVLFLDLGGMGTSASSMQSKPQSDDISTKAVSGDNSFPSQSEQQTANIDFHRLEGDMGRITIELASSDVDLDIVEEGGNIIVNLVGSGLDVGDQQRMDVQDFATPVNFIDTLIKGDSASIMIKPASIPYDYMAYQSGAQLVLDFKPLTRREQDDLKQFEPYTGEKIDLNFQNVEIRTVLQIVAEVAEKNLVVSDNVQGNITLRLKNVPWDQALDIVLKTKGLDKREAGNVLLVGTVEEIAEREAIEMQSQQQEKELAPLVSDFIQIDFRKASEIKDRIIEAKMVSERGFILADDETNILLVRESAKQIAEIRSTIKRFDLEVPQVLIQARLVTASKDFGKNIGVRWGFNDRDSGGNGWSVGSGTFGPGSVSSGLQVDLGVEDTAGTLALGFLSNNFALSAELAALESDGRGEIISQPKVITTNGKPALIKSGQEIPVLERDEDTNQLEVAEWKEVVLKLQVTPQIIPGDKVQLEIDIDDDKLGEVYDTLGNRIINTRNLTTSVVVNDGETVVLGGVFEEQTRDDVEKIPFFGDLPVVGRAFKNRIQSSEKTELLIFITPQMIRESLRQ